MLGDNRLARSTDSGLTWTNLSLPPNPAVPSVNWVSVTAAGNAVSLVVSYRTTPATPGSLSQVDFFSSTDAGQNSSATYRFAEARPPVLLLGDPGSTLFLAAATLLTSTNGGLTWQTIPTTTGEFHSVALVGGSVLLAGERGLEAPDRTISQLPAGQFLKVTFDSLNGIWAGGPAGLFGFFDGSTYAETGVPEIGAVGSIAISNSNILAAGDNAVFSSTDGGAHITSHAVIADGELRARFPPLILDPVTNTTAYVAGRRAYRTTDSGNAWTALGTVDPDPTHVVVALAMPRASRTTLYAATACLPEVALVPCPTQSWVWRSANSGVTWVQVSLVPGFINRLAVDPRQPNTIYAAIGAFPAGPSVSAGFVTGDLLQSINAGTAWVSIRGTLPKVPVNSILIDAASLPANFTQPAQTLYVATDAGVFVTFNAGVQWTDLTGSVIRSLPASPVTDVALLPDGTLAAATFGIGVYTTSVSGLAAGIVVKPLSSEVNIAQGTAVATGILLTNLSLVTTTAWSLNALVPGSPCKTASGTLFPLASTEVTREFPPQVSMPALSRPSPAGSGTIRAKYSCRRARRAGARTDNDRQRQQCRWYSRKCIAALSAIMVLECEGTASAGRYRHIFNFKWRRRTDCAQRHIERCRDCRYGLYSSSDSRFRDDR